jgi:hypothetical protein
MKNKKKALKGSKTARASTKKDREALPDIKSPASRQREESSRKESRMTHERSPEDSNAPRALSS